MFTGGIDDKDDWRPGSGLGWAAEFRILQLAGYSQTPLSKKLGIKPGSRVLAIDAPHSFSRDLEPLPENVELVARAANKLDVAVLFVTQLSRLVPQFVRLTKRIKPAGGIWVAWPKKQSGVETDLSFDAVQRVGLQTGLVDNKICAIDDTWSGLRFVMRVENRPKTR